MSYCSKCMCNHVLARLGHEERLTWVHTNSNNLALDPLSAGIPSYVIQEEFCRFQGFWWQPVASGKHFDRNHYD